MNAPPEGWISPPRLMARDFFAVCLACGVPYVISRIEQSSSHCDRCAARYAFLHLMRQRGLKLIEDERRGEWMSLRRASCPAGYHLDAFGNFIADVEDVATVRAAALAAKGYHVALAYEHNGNVTIVDHATADLPDEPNSHCTACGVYLGGPSSYPAVCSPFCLYFGDPKKYRRQA